METTEVDASLFEDPEWEAVDELVHSGWSRADAIREVFNNMDPEDLDE